MGLLWRLVSPFVSTFNAAPTVKIHDPVLGVANRLLQAIVCCGIAVMLYTDPPLYTEAPNAKAKFFASSGTLAELQAAPATYCGEGHLYGYGDEYCESTRTAGFGLFCEYGLTCANFDYAELNVKGETEMIFPTIVKDLEVELGEASDAFKARCGEASEVRYAGAELTRAAYLENGVYETSDSGQARCKHMNNYWAKGAEGMAMVVQHSYTASTKIPEAYREGTNKDVPTYIHRHGDNLDARGAEIEDVGDWVYRDCTTTAGVHKKRCDFEANEAIRLSVGEWLRIAGIASLDDHNAAAYRPSAQEGVTRLSHRTTGVLVKVTMYYVADHWMKPELHILLQSDDGWHSTGSEVHYVDYPVYDVARDVFVSGRFFDRYKRAVKFEFVTNEGRLRVVEQNVIFLRITALLVFMAISGTLVTMIAQSLLGYKSKVYKAHTKDDVKLEEVGSEIAANAVVAAACFRVACRPGARRLGKGDVFRLLVSTGHEPRAAAPRQLPGRVRRDGAGHRHDGLREPPGRRRPRRGRRAHRPEPRTQRVDEGLPGRARAGRPRHHGRGRLPRRLQRHLQGRRPVAGPLPVEARDERRVAAPRRRRLVPAQHPPAQLRLLQGRRAVGEGQVPQCGERHHTRAAMEAPLLSLETRQKRASPGGATHARVARRWMRRRREPAPGLLY